MGFADLTGPEKAVLMLLTLDESTAAPIVAELDPTELRKLREVASLMRAVPTTSLSSVYAEFIDRGKELIAVPHGGINYLRRLAARALGESKSGEIIEGERSPLDVIGLTAPEAVASVMEHEHPQISAAVLSQLDIEKAAKIVQQLPAEAQLPIVLRLATMTEIPAGLLETVATAVASELPSADAEAPISVDGVAKAAAIIRGLGRELSAQVLTQITDENADLANEIRLNMFTFEDLKKVDARSMRAILTEVSSDILVKSLKTASAETTDHLLSCMSKRAAKLIREDLEMLGAIRLADVEAAQRQVVDTALRLEAAGTITLWQEDN